MTNNPTASELLKAIRRALQHLYDPTELRRSPLPEMLGLPASDNRVAQVRQLLEKAIEAFKPDSSLMGDVPARRYHELLVYRFIEQSGQKEVAADMSLSLRHFQRLEAAALRALTEFLASQYNLSLTWEADGKVEEDLTQVQHEINWLRNHYSTQRIELAELINPVLERLVPLLSGLRVRCDLPPLLSVEVQVVPLQQALQQLLGVIAQSFPHGMLDISARLDNSAIVVLFRAQCRPAGSASTPEAMTEDLSLAESLVSAAGGQLRYHLQPAIFEATLVLKASSESQLVLVVDDNQDTLLLLERYLAGSRYMFSGIRQPERLLSLLDDLHPAVILLDVMLPSIDGWTLLSQLRSHPSGRNVPVIISTILPQEKIALMLGADAFLKKPFTSEELLATLDRLLSSPLF